MPDVIGLGSGGHAKVVIEALRLSGEHQIVGLLDTNRDLWRTEVLGFQVLGGDDMLPELVNNGLGLAFIGLGSAGDNGPRQRLFELALEQGLQVVRTIHPRAVVSPSAGLADGLTVMAGAVINAESQFGVNVIVNTGAIVEHDCVIGSHAHIATGAKLSGTVIVGEGAHIGVGASVRQGINIGEGAIVGAGAAVVKDVEPWTIVAGVPARPLRHREIGSKVASASSSSA